MRKTTRRRTVLGVVVAGVLAGVAGFLPRADASPIAKAAASRLATVDCYGSDCQRLDRGCAWPFIVTAESLNLAYPDANATYWAQPLALGRGEWLELRGTYPSARFMAVTLYDAAGDIITQLSDLDIPPAPGSVNPFAEATVPPDAGDRWRLRVVLGDSSQEGPDVLRLGAGQRAGWLVYRTYLGNPAGDLTGGVPLPTIERYRSGRQTRSSSPCTSFLPGTGIATLLESKLPEPVEVTEAPSLVRIANDAGLFVNAANAYLSAFAVYEPGGILVVRGLLPTFPDTGAGESVVGDFDLRYLSVTSNLNQKPYPVVDGIYDAEMPLDEDGYYTVVVARPADVPQNATPDAGVAVLDWGDGPDQTVIIRNMLPSADFPFAVQDVTPSNYGAPSDAAEVMAEFYPRIAACTRTTFEAGGAAGCFDSAGVPYPGG